MNLTTSRRAVPHNDFVTRPVRAPSRSFPVPVRRADR